MRRNLRAMELVLAAGIPGRGASPGASARGCKAVEIIMQHIGVVRETEKGKVLARFDEGGSIDLRIVKEAPETSCCLRFIDPYGNFVINRYQVPVLTAELNELSRNSNDRTLKSNIQKLVDFLDEAESKQPHIYIKFSGD
jgi:hypothetical protein